MVTLACVSADPLPQVLDVYVNLRKDRGNPLVEARFDSVSGAQLFRREGAKLAKADHSEFASLFFANAVTQATRVRIEVLKALSKKLTTLSESAYVQGFVSRPVLQYHVKEGSRSTADGTGRSYCYVDAISKFGGRLSDRDLATAYLRAGSTFNGAMSQYFVVLKDDLINAAPRFSANRAPLGRRGGRATSSRRGSRSRAASYAEVVADRSPLHVDLEVESDAPDRGKKRPGDPTDEPSKRIENELTTISE